MDYNPHERFYFDEEELYVLLAGLGRMHWYGIETGLAESDIRNMQEIHTVLAKLYQRKVVTWDKGKVKILPPFSAAFRVLENAKFCIQAKKTVFGAPMLCQYYYEDMVVMIKKSRHDRCAVQLSCFGWQDWYAMLWEEGYFPEYIQAAGVTGEKDAFSRQEHDSLGDCRKTEDAVSEFSKFSIDTGKRCGRLLVWDLGLSGLLYMQQGQRSGIYVCEKDCLEERLKIWIREEEDA